MNKTTIYTALAALILLTACSQSDIGETPQQRKEEAQVPLRFGIYMPATRAGTTGELDISRLRKESAFGVYAYYNANTPWDSYYKDDSQHSSDFMYNQRVAYSTTTNRWEYSPIKYWPNGSGNADSGPNQNTGSENYRVSFFAYAPQVTLNTSDASTTTQDPVASEETWGITAIRPVVGRYSTQVPGSVTATTGSGYDLSAPTVDYTNVPGKTVDLLWAAQKDRVKQAVNDSIQFIFAHGLAALEVYVQRDLEDNVADKANGTKIFVGNVTLTVTNTPKSGTMRLDDGSWWNQKLYSDEDPYTYDIISDSIPEDLRGTATANVDPTYYSSLTGTDDETVANKKTADTDIEAIRTTELRTWETKTGVTDTPQKLMASKLLFIPYDADATISPKVTYSFVTHDDNLVLNTTLTSTLNGSTQYYERIYHEDMPGIVDATAGFPTAYGGVTFVGGKKYKLYLYIGVTHVTFDMKVEDWDFPMRLGGLTVDDMQNAKTTVTFDQSE